MDGMMLNQDVTERDVAQAVREAAMLADVSISMWSGERSDRDLLDKVKADTGATGNVGRVIKNMLAGADGKLKDVKSAYAAVRAKHYAITLPWVSNPHAERLSGPRLLPHALFNDWLTAVSVAKREATKQLDEFAQVYPGLVNTAKANLGGMADAVYPTVDEMRAKFNVHFDFEPLPAGSSFKGLPDNVLERLATGLQRKQEAMVGRAVTAAWGEVKDRVGHLVERLADPDTRFKVSTIENVRELVKLLPGWNLVGNDQMVEVTADIEQMLAGVDAKQLRKNDNLRAGVAGKAKAVADKLSGWGI